MLLVTCNYAVWYYTEWHKNKQNLSLLVVFLEAVSDMNIAEMCQQSILFQFPSDILSYCSCFYQYCGE